MEDHDREADKEADKRLHTNNCLDFSYEEFDGLCGSKGIVRHHIVVGTPQKNRVTKRLNKTIMENVRCMLSNYKLPKPFWVEAAVTACFLINWSPSIAIDKKTPIEV